MTESDKILCKLLRIAFGNETDLSLPENVDWNRVMDISFLQDVSSLAVDGYQAIINSNPESKTALDKVEFEDLKYDWFGQNLVQETDYAHQWKTACKVSELFSRHGIDTYIVKGFSISRHFPVPEHRSCCDIDCFLVPSKNSSLNSHDEAYLLGNELVRKQHIKVSDSFYKNSTFTVRGVTFENHRFATPVRGGQRKKVYEAYLQSILESEDIPSDDRAFRYPSDFFTLLFTASHAMNHFLIEGGINLRHVCDWAALLEGFKDDGQLWNKFLEKSAEFGLLKFVNAYTEVARIVCGVEPPFENKADKEAARRLMEDILDLDRPVSDFSDKLSSRISNSLMIVRSSWKFKLYSDTTMPKALKEIVKAFFFEKNPALPL